MQPLCLSLCVAAASAYLAPTNGKRPTTRLAAMREFRAQDLTLERFLGQVSVTEVTDWEYSGEGVNPLDPAQPARTKSDAGVGAAPLRLFLATREDPTARARGEDLRCCVREYSLKASRVARQELDAFRERELPKKSVCQLLGTLDDSEDGFFSSDAVLDDAFIEAWVANLRCEPPQPSSRWLVYEWTGTCTFASLTSPPGPQNPFYAEPPKPFGGGIFGSRAVGERWTYAQREKFVLRAIKNAVACVADLHEAGVAHRGLSGAAFVLDSSGMDKNVVPKNAPLSRVRLQFLGFSDSASVANMNDDLNSLGYVLLELLLSPALYPDYYAGPLPPVSDGDSLKRLYDDIFDCDILKLRDYCANEEAWDGVVRLLDTTDGWAFLGLALGANDKRRATPGLLTARALLGSNFLT